MRKKPKTGSAILVVYYLVMIFQTIVEICVVCLKGLVSVHACCKGIIFIVSFYHEI